jgi:hypothetical protein
MPLVDYLPGRADLIYDGLGGDVLAGARLERWRQRWRCSPADAAVTWRERC